MIVFLSIVIVILVILVIWLIYKFIDMKRKRNEWVEMYLNEKIRNDRNSFY